jgi:2-phosphosulfolactate phosphatase
MMPELEVVLAPALFEFRMIRNDAVIVVVDILRATTTICTALHNGAAAIIPLYDEADLKARADNGCLTAGESQGIQIPGTDFGNSPFEFMNEKIKGREIAMLTTNGTGAVLKAKGNGTVISGAFSNISALTRWVIEKEEDVVVFCAGQNDNFILEDTLFAGALLMRILQEGPFRLTGDPALASVALWQQYRKEPDAITSGARHLKRLIDLGYGKDITYAFSEDTAPVVPFLEGERFVSI